MKRQMKKAFTLIELLVVITIIGILAVWGAAVFTTQIQKARDSTRTTDLAAIKTAVEQFSSDNNQYPPLGAWFNIKPYMQKIPKDPKTGQKAGWTNNSWALDYVYWVKQNVVNYDSMELSATFENAANVTSKSQGDLWDDSDRYELFVNGTGWFINTKAPVSLSWATSWVDSGSNVPVGNVCVAPNGNSYAACTDTDTNTQILVIR